MIHVFFQRIKKQRHRGVLWMYSSLQLISAFGSIGQMDLNQIDLEQMQFRGHQCSFLILPLSPLEHGPSIKQNDIPFTEA